ncbi:unnamed protein product [Didymodactylos carnosus]|uniref:SAM domain-containing protein n=1 Tax=Didymodactylos carnosus TaxID=1234261 RepID=A0A813TIC1_9BILA|nr:unnamed protein product [Didymodactylos carnosus]CAF0872862.1 unnamed protein product [Didymodactylos carnosus]CAF3597855.1 unnamed protein product [Didymodactylos carnosus]CAF3657655.1 unnamed protein product [Didymodactylos carnosus]
MLAGNGANKIITSNKEQTLHNKPIILDFQKYKEKENRRPEVTFTSSSSGGSAPKRYHTVYSEGTPLTSFGINGDVNNPRAHSPPNQQTPQQNQRPLKQVKEFLGVEPNQSDRRYLSAQRDNSNSVRISQIDTVKNVNAALTKTLNKLRPDQPQSNGRSTPMYGYETGFNHNSRSKSNSRPNSIHNNNNYPTVYYGLASHGASGDGGGPLPAELITKRAPTPAATIINVQNNNNSRVPSARSVTNAASTTSAALVTSNPITTVKSQPPRETKSIDIATINSDYNHLPRTPTPTTTRKVQAKSVGTGLHQLDVFNFNSVLLDDQPFENKGQMQVTRKQNHATKLPTTNGTNTKLSLPEVSVNPRIKSTVQQTQQLHRSANNSSDEQLQARELYIIPGSSVNNSESQKHTIQVEQQRSSSNERSSPPLSPVTNKNPRVQIVDVQQQQSRSRPDYAANNLPMANNKLNDAYHEKESEVQTPSTQFTVENETDSTSTLVGMKQNDKNGGDGSTPPPSPATKELNRVWKKHRNKYSIKTVTSTLIARKNIRTHRPPCRLKNYGEQTDDSESITDTQSKEEIAQQKDGMARRQGNHISDLGSDGWSDLTSEFSDSKLRKHPDIRTSTPNITRHSSSLSSKEVLQIRKQLTDLQRMYNDLLKLLDIDIDSIRSSIKSSTSSQQDHPGLLPKKHRFRKVMPSIAYANTDMREVDQRFTRLESSIVTLAESIAKISAQIQLQRVVKDDIYHLRNEVADLRQLMHRQQSTGSSSTAQLRLISANVHRLNTPLNLSTSYIQSMSTIQRSNSIIDPRQARKIEQFFGTEAMLRYFLSLLGYEEYAAVLEQEKIGIYELPYISERKLHSLGIPSGPGTRIVYEAQQYFISLLTLKSSGVDV